MTGGAGSILGGFAAVADPEVTIALLERERFGDRHRRENLGRRLRRLQHRRHHRLRGVRAVSGTSDSILGGFAAVNVGWIDPSTAIGAVSASGNNNILGGFAGLNLGSIDFATSYGS